MSRLLLGTELLARIEREARCAFPRECCGLIEGVRSGGAIEATHVHATRNLCAGADCFEIDPVEHIALSRAARAAGRQIVGCYHSHPDGGAHLSARDRGGASEEGFVWLIAALRGDGPVHVGCHVRQKGVWHEWPVDTADRACRILQRSARLDRSHLRTL